MSPHRMCRCGHFAEAHAHWRRGTDCSALNCSCPQLRVRWSPKPGGLLWTLQAFAGLARQVR